MLLQRIDASRPGSDVDIAWAAGFWDGEGSFMRDKRTDLPTLQVSQAGDEGQALLARFARALGARAAVYEGWRKSDHHKLAYKVHIDGQAAVDAFALCRPYLSQTKVTQATTAIAAWRQRQANYVHPSSAKTHCKHGHPFTPDNTFINANGARCCITCRRKRGLAAYYRARAARVEVTQQREAEERAQDPVEERVVETIVERTELERSD